MNDSLGEYASMQVAPSDYTLDNVNADFDVVNGEAVIQVHAHQMTPEMEYSPKGTLGLVQKIVESMASAQFFRDVKIRAHVSNTNGYEDDYASEEGDDDEDLQSDSIISTLGELRSNAETSLCDSEWNCQEMDQRDENLWKDTSVDQEVDIEDVEECTDIEDVEEEHLDKRTVTRLGYKLSDTDGKSVSSKSCEGRTVMIVDYEDRLKERVLEELSNTKVQPGQVFGLELPFTVTTVQLMLNLWETLANFTDLERIIIELPIIPEDAKHIMELVTFACPSVTSFSFKVRRRRD